MTATFPALALDDTEVDYDALLRGNALDIFSEPDPAKRIGALERLWAPEGTLVDPDRIVTGTAAISDSVGALLAMLPPGTRFAPQGPAIGHHGIARLDWRATGPDGAPGPVTGTDIALVEKGRIVRLYVILDPSA